MAKISLLNIFDDLIRTSDVLTAGIEKGIFCFFDFVFDSFDVKFLSSKAYSKVIETLTLAVIVVCRSKSCLICYIVGGLLRVEIDLLTACSGRSHTFSCCFLIEFISFVSHQENCRQQWCLEQDELTKLRKENAKLKVFY